MAERLAPVAAVTALEWRQAGQATDVRCGQIGMGQHRMHAGQGEGGSFVDAVDPGVRIRAAHKRGVQHLRQMDVVDKLACAAQQRRVFLTFDRSAEAGKRVGVFYAIVRAHCAASRIIFAASSAAATMP